MDENVIVTRFSADSSAYEALARLKAPAGEGQIDLQDGAVVDAEDDDETDSVLEHISRSIGKGEAAVLTDIDESSPAAVDGAMAAFGGRVTRYARKELRDQRHEATIEKVEAKLRELRERVRHLVRH